MLVAMRQDPAGVVVRVARCALVAFVALAAGGCPGTPKPESPVQPAPAPPSPPAEEEAAPAQPAGGPRKIYLTAGHGELTHPASQLAGSQPGRRSSELRRMIGLFDHEVAELAPADLTRAVPGDAAIVVVAAPAIPLQPAEWTSLDRYIERGGRVLIVLDPTGATSMGPLEGRLGLRMLAGHLTDDKNFLPLKGTPSDRRAAITNQFSAHPSTDGLARGAGKGMVMIDAGALEEIPFTSKGRAPIRTITIRSMDSAWLDLEQPQNFTFDTATERRGRWNLGAAVAGPRSAGRDGFRALVFSDAEMFADVLIAGPGGKPQWVLLYPTLLADSITWLGGRRPVGDTKATTASKDDPSDEAPPKREQIAPPLDLRRPPPDAIRLPSGLIYKKLVANAAGAAAKRNDTVLIDYTGWRQSTGETFYSNRSRGQPLPISLASAAPGIIEALQLLRKGERAMLWVPASIGHLTQPPPHSDTLVYDMELVDIQPAPEVPADLKAPAANARALKSGTKYVVVRPGTGTGTQKARSFDTVTFHVTSWESDGRQVDSTEVRQRPQTSAPYRQVAALEEVLTSMTVGQRVRFWLDAARARPDASEPEAPRGLLTYELEILQIDPAAAAPPPVPPDVAKPPRGAKKTAAGTSYKVLKAGKGGPKPKPADIVVVHYTGWTTDGRMFDSSVTRGASAEFPLDAVIPGWTDGLQVMSVGDQVRFWIPEELAYKGKRGRPQGTLVFDVELLEIKPAP
jgi:FKBP-type peptidyl-prolyl cis-trans isomerase